MSFLGFLKQSTAVDVKIGPFVDSGDGDAEETGLTIAASDVILSKNGQTGGAKNDATAAAHAEDGMYNCEFDATDTDTVGQLTLGVHVAGALFVRHDFQVLEEAVYDRDYAASATGVDADWTNAGRLDTLLDAIPTTAMRGTDDGALATVCTEARLAELAAANLPSDIDAVLADTNELQGDWVNGGRLDLIVDAILVDTGTTLDGKLPTVLVSGRMNSSVGAMAAGVITDAAAAADAFDNLLVRDMDAVEASAPLHSLTTAVLKAVSRVRDNAGTLEVFRTDGTTVHMSQTVTADATLDPIDELTAGV